MPVEFISATHISDDHRKVGTGLTGFDPGYTRRFARPLAGKHTKSEDSSADIRPVQDQIPISVGGSSQQAYEVGGRQGDIFGLWGEPLAETTQQIASVNAVADAAGRPRPRIWVSFRPI